MSERQRLLRAALIESSEHGQAEFSLAAAAERAGVGEEATAEFADAEACLDAAYEQLSGEVMDAARAGCKGKRGWPERVRGSIEGLTWRLAAEPEMARALTQTFPGNRPGTYRRYFELFDGLLPLMREGRRYSGVAAELPGEVELLALATAQAIIFDAVGSGRTEALPALVPEILFSVLVAFLGPERASAEMPSAVASA